MGAVAAINLGSLAPILAGLEIGLLNQLGDLLLAEVGAPLDADALLAPGGAVGRRHLQQAVGIDVEGDLHLGHTPGRRRNARETKTPQALVIKRHLPLPLQHVDLHRALVGLRRAEQIALAHRDRGVAGDQHLHHAANGFQTQRKGRDVVEHQIAQLTGEDPRLHRSTDRHHLVGVHRLAGLQRNKGAHHLLHHRHAGAAAHQHDVVDVFGREGRIPQGPLHRPQQPIKQIGAEALKHPPLQGGFDMQRPVGAGGNKRQGNRCALHTTELDLGFLRCFGEPLQGLAVPAQINAVLCQEGIGQPINNAPVPIVAAQLGVTAGGLHIEHPLGDAQHGHIKGATAQVKHQHPLDSAAIEAVGQGCRGGLIEDPLNADPSQAAGIAGGLALGVVEVGRHGDHRRLHGFAEVGGGVITELAQHAGNQLFRGVFPFGGWAHHPHVALVVGPHAVGHRQTVLLELVPLPANETLEVGEGIAWVEHKLTPGQLTDEQLLVATEAHHRGGGAAAFSAGDHLGTAALQYRHH